MTRWTSTTRTTRFANPHRSKRTPIGSPESQDEYVRQPDLIITPPKPLQHTRSTDTHGSQEVRAHHRRNHGLLSAIFFLLAAAGITVSLSTLVLYHLDVALTIESLLSQVWVR